MSKYLVGTDVGIYGTVFYFIIGTTPKPHPFYVDHTSFLVILQRLRGCDFVYLSCNVSCSCDINLRIYLESGTINRLSYYISGAVKYKYDNSGTLGNHVMQGFIQYFWLGRGKKDHARLLMQTVMHIGPDLKEVNLNQVLDISKDQTIA